MKTIAFYHRSDFDGVFCREIVRHFLPDAELVGYEYGDPVPVVEADQILMLDISIAALMDRPELVWIDHHATAIEKFSPSIRGYRIDGVAACRLAWQWFVKHITAALPAKEDYIDRKVREPLAVRLAGEYDIWDRRDPDAELFQHGLRSQELSENDWQKLLEVDPAPIVPKLLQQARIVHYAKTRENQLTIEANGFDLNWEGTSFLACNAGQYNSHLFASGVKPHHEALLGFAWRASKWSVSLYGVPNHPEKDLSVIANKYGGGGHKQACGFTCQKLPFNLCQA